MGDGTLANSTTGTRVDVWDCAQGPEVFMHSPFGQRLRFLERTLRPRARGHNQLPVTVRGDAEAVLHGQGRAVAFARRGGRA
jgi:hypothetical protein